MQSPSQGLQQVFGGLDFTAADGSEIAGALAQLSPQAYASTTGILASSGGAMRSAVNGRMRSVATGSRVNASSKGASLAANPRAVARDGQRGSEIWATAYGSRETQGASGGVAGTKSRQSGIASGLDMRGQNDWLVGMAVGYGRLNFNARDGAFSGKSNDLTLGIYTARDWAMGAGTLGLRSGVSYTSHDVDVTRQLSFGGYSDRLVGEFKARSLQLFAELGYRSNLGDGTSLEPYANLAHVRVKTDGFTETGTSGAALAVSAGRMEATLATLGLRLSKGITLGEGRATLRTDLGWRRAFGDAVPNASASFAAGSHGFSAVGGAVGKETVLLEAGIDFDLSRRAVLGISYQGQFGSGVNHSGLAANFTLKF